MTKYQHVSVDGDKIFYREDGPKTAPIILLLKRARRDRLAQFRAAVS